MLAPSQVYLVGIDEFGANADEERLNVIGGVVIGSWLPRGGPTLVMTAAVSTVDDFDFPQATANERRAIVRRLRRRISAILRNGLEISRLHVPRTPNP
jgi:hypothetical protein